MAPLRLSAEIINTSSNLGTKGENKVNRFLICIIILSIVILSACNINSQKNSVLNPILNEFEEAGIVLEVQDKRSKTFTFLGSDDKQYEFNGGNIYIIYNYKDKDEIVEKLTGVFAETDFPYNVKKLYKEEFCIIFVASNENPETEQKVESIFDNL